MTRASKIKERSDRPAPRARRSSQPFYLSGKLWGGVAAVALLVGAALLFQRRSQDSAPAPDQAAKGAPVPLSEATAASDAAPRRTAVPDSRMINVGDDPVKGSANAPVRIVEFADFECPSCGQFFLNTEGSLNALYGDRIQWAFLDFPLQQHARALPAAIAAQCAHLQGKFWPYHDLVFANQAKLSDDDLRDYADRVGLDRKKWDACFEKQETLPAVQEDVELGNDLGVDATPSFFVGGQTLKGAMPITSFMEIIDPLLREAGGDTGTAQATSGATPGAAGDAPTNAAEGAAAGASPAAPAAPGAPPGAAAAGADSAGPGN
jgi:protein-disulfide isomerase